MLSVEDAVALVVASRLFDHEWYAEQCGHTFATRDDAARHWVVDRDADASPHPLFEPTWLYPSGRWRRDAPDPLSYYLLRPDAPSRDPHPRYRHSELGGLEAWLDEHDPAELLADPLPRDVGAAEVVVELQTVGLHRAVAWLRHLSRLEPDVVVVVRSASRSAHRVLQAVAASRPRVLLDPVRDLGDGLSAPVRVTIEAEVAPPRWRWLPDLVAALDTEGVAAAQPLLLNADFTVAAPLLVGHPVQDAERLTGLALPEPYPGVIARRSDRPDGSTVLVTGSRLFGPSHVDNGPGWAALWAGLWEPAGFAGPGQVLRVREGKPALRWAIDIPAGAGPIGTRWGDWHFARSLASALERLGQWVSIDHPETRRRSSRGLDDVVLTLRGIERVDPPTHTTNLLWVIYNPDQVTAEEAGCHDAVFAAGATWSAARSEEWGIEIRPLLQCTDTTRFHPRVEAASGPPGADGVLFVGNARGGMRPVVQAAITAGIDVSVVGANWGEFLPAARVRTVANRIANEDLPSAYASAGVVLNDHHADMRVQGFVTNRVFDVLAVGGRLLSDPVEGLQEVLGPGAPALPTWETPADLARLAHPPYEAWPDDAARLALAAHVVAEHSFDSRAATLLAAAVRHRTGH